MASEEQKRPLYVCQKCGEEVGEGEQDHRGRHPICGGQLDQIGYCDDFFDDNNSEAVLDEVRRKDNPR